MRFATICVCFCAILTWFETTEASPMGNFFQMAKKTFTDAIGGESNPGVAMGQKMLDMMKADDWQNKMHDVFSNMTEGASKEMKELGQTWMAEMQKMAAGGASQDQMKEKFSEMLNKYGKSMPSGK